MYLGIPALCKYLLSGVKWSQLPTCGAFFFYRRLHNSNTWVGMGSFHRMSDFYFFFNIALFGKIIVLPVISTGIQQLQNASLHPVVLWSREAGKGGFHLLTILL